MNCYFISAKKFAKSASQSFGQFCFASSREVFIEMSFQRSEFVGDGQELDDGCEKVVPLCLPLKKRRIITSESEVPLPIKKRWIYFAGKFQN